MAHTSPIAPAFPGGRAPASRSARAHFKARRRVCLGLVVLLLIGLAALTNYGPLRAYQESRARLDSAAAQVAALSDQKDQLQAELGKLGEAGYLEGLAREELTYAKPGEEIYIVTGGTDAETGAADEDAASSTEHQPGLLERMLRALGDLF